MGTAAERPVTTVQGLTVAGRLSLRRVREHLRLYESAQILVPGGIGLLSGGALPPLPSIVLYGIAYFTHVLSVYSFNDYCDHDSDGANPRKSGSRARSVAWLRNQTAVLSAVFLASVAALPAAVAGLFLLNQVVCMAYSHPRLRLKRRLLGSECAHFLAGSSYYLTGVLLAGGAATAHLPGAVLFGLLYLSGGTFNEIMDCEPDRRAHLRHLVVRAGPRRSLRLVFAVHGCALVLLAAHWRTPLVVAACVAAAPVYAVLARRVAAAIGDPPALLRFRAAYRMLFAGLLVLVALQQAAALARG
jgi:4-hydroxybenzoate polyprenyltransferase